MASSRPALNGEIQADGAIRLRREIAGLEAELREAREDAEKYKQAASDSVHAIKALRKQLQPLYDAMRMIFGEISRVDAGPAETAGSSGGDPKWESWKKRLGGKPAEFIDLLLINERMTITQLAAAGRCHYDTAKAAVRKMREVGIATNDSSGVSLR